ncbi:MAG: RNA polymerase sigma factor [Hyphomicrobiales bacterium]
MKGRSITNSSFHEYDLLYRRHSAKMYSICIRYLKDKNDAEDALQDGFIKVFSSIDQLKNKKLVVQWMRRIFINTSLDYLRKRQSFSDISSLNLKEEQKAEPETTYDRINKMIDVGKISYMDIVNLLNLLPDNYRIVFNLFVFEGWKHKEIASHLKISENTSKSHLLRARAALQDYLLNISNKKDDNSKYLFLLFTLPFEDMSAVINKVDVSGLPEVPDFNFSLLSSSNLATSSLFFKFKSVFSFTGVKAKLIYGVVLISGVSSYFLLNQKASVNPSPSHEIVVYDSSKTEIPMVINNDTIDNKSLESELLTVDTLNSDYSNVKPKVVNKKIIIKKKTVVIR